MADRTWMKWVGLGLGCAAAALVLTTARAGTRAQQANARADSMATVAAQAQIEAQGALTEHDRLTSVVAELEARQGIVDTVVIRARAAVPNVDPETPATDTSWKARSLAQDEVIEAQSEAIAVRDSAIIVLKLDNAGMASSLLDVEGALAAASAELRSQAGRTEVAPRKIFGIPLPVLTLGYGATVAGGEVHTGPQVNLGWKVAL